MYVRLLENVPNPGMDSAVPYALDTAPPFILKDDCVRKGDGCERARLIE